MAVVSSWSMQPWALRVCCSTDPALPKCWQYGLHEKLYSHLTDSVAVVRQGEHRMAGWGEIWQACVLCELSERLQMKQIFSGRIWKMRAVESGAKLWCSWMLSSRAALLFGSHQGLLGRMSQSLARANAVLMGLKHEHPYCMSLVQGLNRRHLQSWNEPVLQTHQTQMLHCAVWKRHADSGLRGLELLRKGHREAMSSPLKV